MLVKDEIEIAAPPDLVWDVFSDVVGWPTWTASVTSLDLLDVPLRVGARAKIRQPKLPTVVWTVTELTPGESWTWIAKSPGAKTVATHRVTANGPGTRVEQSIAQTGLFGRFVGLLYRRLTRRYVAMEAAGLKRECETRVAALG
jgi:uncharacterized protein YndB with AHSA1/START domain